ncbi:MAG: FMN-binding protein [Lachnospiraceae bacterium]|jgi:uncharacterized protein with FMN-binding domain|nr:FMN-binding protein [Lachnospiraceae bacterium]
MKRYGKIMGQVAAFFLAASLCLIQAGCSCGEPEKETTPGGSMGNTTSGSTTSAGAGNGSSENPNTPATSSTDGVNQMTTPEHGTTTGNGMDESSGSGSGTDGSGEDVTHTAGAVGGGTADGTSYEPGTYTGTAQGYAGPIHVTVEVDETGIVSVTAVGESETPGVGQAAIEKLSAKIAEENSTDIDVMAGATFSSKGLFEAVENALAEAGKEQ